MRILTPQQDIINALNSGPAIPATVSFDVRWSRPAKKKVLRNAQHKFAAAVVETSSTIAWQADRGDMQLAADAGSARSKYAFIGRERNGVFFG